MRKINQGDAPAASDAGESHESTSKMYQSGSGTEDSTMSCEVCNDSGWLVYDVPVGHPQFGQLCRCPACGPRRATEQSAVRHDIRRAALASELGGRLARCSFDNFSLDRSITGGVSLGSRVFSIDEQRDMLRRALETCQCYAAQPAGWLYLFGTYGSGKSHLAAAIANHCTQSMSVTYSTTATLWNWLRAGYKEDCFNERLAALCNVDLLVLDDLNAERTTEFVDETLFTLINTRYNHERHTILTSNEAMSKLPGRVASRVRELSQQVFLAVSDYRELCTG
jgi:DNA replication protein DnaC